jgi:hypothetical protein
VPAAAADAATLSLSTRCFLCVGIEDVLPAEIALFRGSSSCRFSSCG